MNQLAHHKRARLGVGSSSHAQAGFHTFARKTITRSAIETQRFYVIPYTYMGVVSWLTPGKVGPGQIQPNARFQYADWATQSRLVLDFGLAYVVDGFNHKYHLNYRHAETEPDGLDTVAADSIQFGFQYLMGL